MPRTRHWLVAGLLLLPVTPFNWIWLTDRKNVAQSLTEKVAVTERQIAELEAVMGEASALPDDLRALEKARRVRDTSPAVLVLLGTADDPRACEAWLSRLPGRRVVAFKHEKGQFQATLERHAP